MVKKNLQEKASNRFAIYSFPSPFTLDLDRGNLSRGHQKNIKK